MNGKTLWNRLMTLALAMLMMMGCAAPPKSDSLSQSESGPELSVAVQPSGAATADYTRVSLTEGQLTAQAGSAYYLPLGEGKYIPAADPVWLDYLDGMELSPLESLSMPFVGVDCGDSAVVYVIENPYRTTLRFHKGPMLGLTLAGEPSTLDPEAQIDLRVYTTDNNAAAVAGVYKSYLAETRKPLTLADKAKKNPDVVKLYGAPHVYLWGDLLLGEQDINWQALRKAAASPVLAHVNRLLAGSEEGTAFSKALEAIAGQDYVDSYQRSVILRGFSVALSREDFYDPAIFAAAQPPDAAAHPAQYIEGNKQALYKSLTGVFQPVDGWYDHETVDVLNEMKAAGIDRAWVGLNSYEQLYHAPQLAGAVAKNGYLIGPYDSYHSIHAPGKEQWLTAAFPDTDLYENATVEDKNGNKLGGFQKVGRKLNPTLALPSVQARVKEILASGAAVNSWFVDCDATGEVYDDYSPAHPTTKQQDVAARLERMDYIAEQGLVVGSEGGNDFAADSIAFAHGIELQSFSWMDEDMKGNRESKYYLGRYYSAKGGVPEKFAKPVPVKEKYRKLFLDMSYQIPLYKLVHNANVITSYHWDWSTFKITGEIENRMLREVLYNVPPMYHLDRGEWELYKDRIITHNAVWSPFSTKAVQREMTDFAQLTDDRLVQRTRYGKDLEAVANFSDSIYSYNGTSIPPRSVLILDGGRATVYTP